MLPPWAILAISVVLLYAAWLIDRWAARRRARQLRAVAAEAKVHYSRTDRFGIAERLAEHFPTAAPQGLWVRDLMYCRGQGCYSYVFTADYQPIREAGRRRVVAAVDEPGDRAATRFTQIRIADDSLPLAQQYRTLLARSA